MENGNKAKYMYLKVELEYNTKVILHQCSTVCLSAGVLVNNLAVYRLLLLIVNFFF